MSKIKKILSRVIRCSEPWENEPQDPFYQMKFFKLKVLENNLENLKRKRHHPKNAVFGNIVLSYNKNRHSWKGSFGENLGWNPRISVILG